MTCGHEESASARDISRTVLRRQPTWAAIINEATNTKRSVDTPRERQQQKQDQRESYSERGFHVYVCVLGCRLLC